jgi:hypothetical protein
MDETEVDPTEATEELPVDTTDYYANEMLHSIAYNTNVIARFCQKVDSWFNWMMYAILAAYVGWAIGSLLSL